MKLGVIKRLDATPELDEIYRSIYNTRGALLSLDDINPALQHTILYQTPGIRLYRKLDGKGHMLPETFFVPNKFTNPKLYARLVERYKKN